MYKLYQAGIGGKFLKIIQNMYSSVSFAVKCENKKTDSFYTSVGVKQGCVLSPMFFNIYLNDLPTIFNDDCDPVCLNDSPLSCLMYADDLVIMSKSSSGLQNALDKLHDYCSKWKLSVNINKTKIMIFNKRGHTLSKYSFTYGNIVLQLCNEYSYLGIIFTPSGSFTKAINILKDKACKAFFKIRENLYNSSVKCGFKLFNSLLRPILCYGCEIWAPYLLKGLKNGNFIDICDKVSGENLHIKFCKLILGVHRKATNHAVRGELGSYPLLIFMLSISLKYWWKLNNDCLMGSSSLAIHALIDNRLSHNVNFFTWSNGIKYICNLFGNNELWDKPNILHKTSVVKTISSSLSSVYNNEWLTNISNVQSKLRTYGTFKNKFRKIMFPY